jgi:hypothetical protein
MKKSAVHYLWKNSGIARDFVTSVCLHGHTLFSKENFGPVYQHALHIPLLSWLVQKEMERYEANHGKSLDLSRAYWTPPLSPRDAVACETKQIEQKLDLEALVSLTDHDDIQAASLLLSVDGTKDVPISFEWTVPFGRTYFHLGVHNLPPHEAATLKSSLCRYKQEPDGALLSELLSLLNEYPDVLIVFNHPLWNQAGVSEELHISLVEAFLQQYGRWLHAFELSGVNAWRKNKKAMALAEAEGKPIVAGGDRHACRPASVLNLTQARTFSEFVGEVRHDEVSNVVVLPQYLEPLKLRHLEDLWDIIRDYPEHPFGRKYWNERTFYVDDGEDHRPLFVYLEFGGNNYPRPIRYFFGFMRFLESHPQLRPALKQALNDGEGIP